MNWSIEKILKQQTQTQTTTTDENGKQLEKTEMNVFSVPTEPPYIKMYLQDILYLKDMPRGLNPILENE